MHNLRTAFAAGEAALVQAPLSRASEDLHALGIADQAALVIVGEAYALAYLDRLRSDTAHPNDLAVLLSFLTGAMLTGACRVIEKALGVHHHA